MNLLEETIEIIELKNSLRGVTTLDDEGAQSLINKISDICEYHSVSAIDVTKEFIKSLIFRAIHEDDYINEVNRIIRYRK